MLYKSVLDAVGNTPIIRLEKLSKRLSRNVFLKLEQLNPGGSHKVRIALNIILEAEKKGILIRDTNQVILAPTGGNTGIGLAMSAAVLNYKLVLVIPDNYSKEKQNLLKLYGAEIVLSDSTNGNNSHGDKATELALVNPDYVLLDQQSDPANPQAHRKSTAIEILECLGDCQVDYFIGGIGTGGHITGIGEILKERNKNIQIIGVQPNGCDLLANSFMPHDIQGLAVGIIPDNLNVDIIDRMISVNFIDAKNMMKTIMREEGISIGISTGANIVAISELAKNTAKDANILTLAYDSAESYLDIFSQSYIQDNNQRECYEYSMSN